MVYTNQLGDARIAGTLPANPVQAYGFALNTAAPVAANLTGPAHIAFYGDAGQPDRLSNATTTGATLLASVPARQLTHFAVQGADSFATGTYALAIDGPRPRGMQGLFVSKATGIGAALGAIGTLYETDFYHFTTTQAGEWTVTIKGVKTLDVSINVFDAAGNPVGGTFMSPINAGGAGQAETWTGKGLSAGAQYFIRVDSPNNSRGSYAIDVKRTLLATEKPILPPALTVTALTRQINEDATGTAKFHISRPTGSDLSSPLLVYYRPGGTAKSGADYKALKGYIVIPANRLYATVSVAPLADDLYEGDEQVVLALRPTVAYRIDKPSKASTAIIEQPQLVQGWPEAPFAGGFQRATVYANQLGDAIVTGTIKEGEFHGYEIYYDDPGQLKLDITGSVKTKLAFYGNYGGLPTKESSGSFAVPVPADKRSLYIGVLGTSAGTYTLKLDGPLQFLNKTVLKNNAGSNGSTISSSGDSDFFSFTTTTAGVWVVEAIPDKAVKPLDVEMMLYDAAGKPIAGTFTKPINNGGRGFHERWKGKLKASSRYYLRVDGVGDWITEDYGFGVGMFLL